MRRRGIFFSTGDNMSKFMDRAVEEAKKRGGTVYGISQIHNGIAENVTITPANPCQDTYSVAKAFTVTAIGMLWDDGVLDTDERIVDIFRDELCDGMDPKWQEMTVHHVLKHRCGFPGGYVDIDCIDVNTMGEDLLQYLFKTKLLYSPGEQKTYSDGAYYLLSRVVTKKTGFGLDEFLWRRLFFPLGFREAAWSKCPMGYAMGATGLYIYTSDMVKLGQLYLDGGVYNGKRIISEEWVDIVKQREYEFERTPHGGYRKGGMRGQMVMFYPEQNRAVAWHSYEGDVAVDLWIEEYAQEAE